MNEPPKKKQRKHHEGNLDVEELKRKLEILRKEKEEVASEFDDRIKKDKEVAMNKIGDMTKLKEEIEALESEIRELEESVEQDEGIGRDGAKS
ncbi:hypothetical protein GLAREA_06730 [Glarea lozoyensis ATCC 20868]|uniref:Uncharacterized protein n=1 Tax=Glarea lozoyensis (strain ATCC 20868 / MF5171) TaxID=1116229 RepID=S3D5H9_GLAL2|nr:uncharacterized protein GLAREA_06730 [Glarea lozoyensis ATCC 20868]EPE33717.1 hypothetical protein GLAREA_06730 [Glarea lozoyensis ATCC 20868]